MSLADRAGFIRRNYGDIEAAARERREGAVMEPRKCQHCDGRGFIWYGAPGGGGERIKCIWCNDGVPLDESDLNLHAAARDMLAALEEIADLADRMANLSASAGALRERETLRAQIEERAMAAIAKARGERA